MFVTNHVLSGVAIGRAFRRRPAAAFVAGVASHLALDACPHWGVDFRAPGQADRFLRVARRDGVLGLVAMALITAAVEPGARVSTVAAMFGAVTPDLDKPCQYFFGFNPFPKRVNQFHRWIQNQEDHRLPHELAVGAGLATLDLLLLDRGAGRRRFWSALR